MPGELKGPLGPRIDELGRPLGGPGLLEGLPSNPAQAAAYQEMLRRKAAYERENTLRWLHARGGSPVDTDVGEPKMPTLEPRSMGSPGDSTDFKAQEIELLQQRFNAQILDQLKAQAAARDAKALEGLAPKDRAEVENRERHRVRFLEQVPEEESLKALRRHGKPTL